MLLIFAPHILFTAYRDTLRALPRPKDMVKPARRVFGLALVAYLYYSTDGQGGVVCPLAPRSKRAFHSSSFF